MLSSPNYAFNDILSDVFNNIPCDVFLIDQEEIVVYFLYLDSNSK